MRTIFHHVFNPLSSEAVAMNNLVGQRQLVEDAIQMANRRMHIDRFDRISAHQMNAVEVLAHLDEVAITLHVTGAPTSV